MIESDLDEIGEAEVRHRLSRGDYHDPSELSVISKWLRRKDEANKFLESCRNASVSAALDASRSARRANFIALFAAIVALMSGHAQIKEFFGLMLDLVKP